MKNKQIILEALRLGLEILDADNNLLDVTMLDDGADVQFADGSFAEVRVEMTADFSDQQEPGLITGAEHWDPKKY